MEKVLQKDQYKKEQEMENIENEILQWIKQAKIPTQKFKSKLERNISAAKLKLSVVEAMKLKKVHFQPKKKISHKIIVNYE